MSTYETVEKFKQQSMSQGNIRSIDRQESKELCSLKVIIYMEARELQEKEKDRKQKRSNANATKLKTKHQDRQEKGKRYRE